jgi:putative hydrolase of the HAD superfamily
MAFKDARNEIKKRLGTVASSHSRLLYMQRAIEKLGLGTRILLVLDLEQTYWRTFLQLQTIS